MNDSLEYWSWVATIVGTTSTIFGCFIAALRRHWIRLLLNVCHRAIVKTSIVPGLLSPATGLSGFRGWIGICPLERLSNVAREAGDFYPTLPPLSHVVKYLRATLPRVDTEGRQTIIAARRTQEGKCYVDICILAAVKLVAIELARSEGTSMVWSIAMGESLPLRQRSTAAA